MHILNICHIFVLLLNGKTIKTMAAKVGKYFFGRNYGSWAVWVYDFVNNETGFTSASKVANCITFDEALTTTYQLNGWGTPKSIKRTF